MCRGRQETSLLRQVKFLPGTTNGRQQHRCTVIKEHTGHRNRKANVLSRRRNSPVDCFRRIVSVMGIRKPHNRSCEVLCSRYLSSRVGQRIVLPSASVRRTLAGRKKPPPFCGGLCSRYLSSRAVTRQVLSAYMSLTSVFGMGTGGPS